MSLAMSERAPVPGQSGRVETGRESGPAWRRAQRRLAATVVAAALISLPAILASASEFTFEDFTLDSTEDLLDICTVEPSNASHFESAAFCYGFFQGAVHYHRALASGPGFGPIVCAPETATVRQLVGIFVTYAQAHPEHLAEPPIDTAFRALVEQWPCG